ncbi:MAG: hypothetical protein ACYC5O_21170 [Anaerolineae bacterium]
MSARTRYVRVPSDTYVYAKIDPADVQATATGIMVRLAGFHSYTFLTPWEEVSLADVPAEALEHWGARPETMSTAALESGGDADEEPIVLHWPAGTEPAAGEYLVRLPSATYSRIEVPADDIEGTWKAVKADLRSPRSASVGVADVYVLPLKQAPGDLCQWVLYGATDRVVVPLWPEDQIEDPEKIDAWKGLPATLEQILPFSGPYMRVVAVWPEHTRGMLCRIWHARRDDKPGLGTVYGRYPVDVAVAVPSPKRTPHIHSFENVRMQDWRPGLVFYNQPGEDGCPISYVGERLDQFCSDEGWVAEPKWRAWLESK